jgi:lysophospholipase L1-like esterase
MKVEILLGRLFIALVSIALSLGLVEYGSRWFISARAPIERNFPVEVVRQPQPYTMFGGAPQAQFQAEDQVIQLNALGYRGPLPEKEKAPGDYRIFVLGGSTVFLGDPSIPELLQEEFRRNGPAQVSVYNFGVVSSVSGMEVARLVFEVSELEPDLIIMYNGGNDIMGPYRFDPRPGYPFNFLVYEHNPLLESEIGAYPAGSLLAYGSNLARYFFPDYFTRTFADIEQLRQTVGWGSEVWRDDVAAAYVDNLGKAHKIAQAFGADFIAFAQPMVYFKEPLAPEEAAQANHAERRAYALDMRDRIHKKVAQLSASQPDLKIVDLTDMYDDRPEWVFTDNIHTRQESKPLVAQAMYAAVSQYFDVTRGPEAGSP